MNLHRRPSAGAPSHRLTIGEAPVVRWALIAVALCFLTVFLFVPLVFVFYEGLKKGLDVYLAAISEPDALAAIRLTLATAAIAVPCNLIFGVCAATVYLIRQ